MKKYVDHISRITGLISHSSTLQLKVLLNITSSTRLLSYTARCLKQRTHYDVLNIAEDSTQEDIKNAYFKLTKELHPDMNKKSRGDDKKFIAVVQAYEILGKPQSRSQYDEQLKSTTLYNYQGISTNAPPHRVIFRDDSIYSMRTDIPNSPKVKRVPNWYIALGAVVLMVVGGFIHLAVALRSGQIASENLRLKDEAANKILKHAQEQGRINGVEEQVRIFKDRIKLENSCEK